MTRAEARDLARGHAARCLESHLEAGWPDADEFGYADDEAILIVDEIHRIAVRLNGGQQP